MGRERYFGHETDLGDAEIRGLVASSKAVTLQIWWLRTWFETNDYLEGIVHISQNVVDDIYVESGLPSGALRLVVEPTVGAAIDLNATAYSATVEEMSRAFRPGWTRRMVR